MPVVVLSKPDGLRYARIVGIGIAPSDGTVPMLAVGTGRAEDGRAQFNVDGNHSINLLV